MVQAPIPCLPTSRQPNLASWSTPSSGTSPSSSSTGRGKQWQGLNSHQNVRWGFSSQVWTQRQHSSHCGGRGWEAALKLHSCQQLLNWPWWQLYHQLAGDRDHQLTQGSPAGKKQTRPTMLSSNEDFPHRPRLGFVRCYKLKKWSCVASYVSYAAVENIHWNCIHLKDKLTRSSNGHKIPQSQLK